MSGMGLRSGRLATSGAVASFPRAALFGRSWFDRASTALAMRLCRCDWGFFPAALRRLRSKCSVAKLPTIDSSGRRPIAFMARALAIGHDFDVSLRTSAVAGSKARLTSRSMLIARKSSQACTLASLHLKSGALQFHTQSSGIACALDIGTSPIATAPNADRCNAARNFH